MKSQNIIRLYNALQGLFNLAASLIWGINTLFLLDAGLTIGQVFIVNACFTGGMALFEIPTGVFADTLGRKFSFFTGIVMLIFTTLAYVAGRQMENNFVYFMVASVFVGLAYTFYSGAVEAWVVDALNHSGYSGDLDSVFGQSMFAISIAMLIGTVSGGFLGNIDLSLPYIVRACILAIVAIIVLIMMKDIGFERRTLTIQRIPVEMKTVFGDSIKYGIGHRSVLKLMSVSFLYSSFMMWGWYAWQPHFLEQFGDKDAVWLAGIVSACISIAMAVGNISVTKASKLFPARSHLLIFTYALKGICILVIGFSNTFLLSVSAFLVFSYCMGLASPVKQAFLNALIPSDKRATILSFDSLVGSSGSVIGQVGLGGVAQYQGIGPGYVISGFVILAAQIPLYMLKRDKLKEDQKS